MSGGFDAHRQHQPQVPDRSHSAQLAFAQQPFEVLVFVLPCGQGNLPSVGRFKRVLDELVPNGCQFGSFRFGVAQDSTSRSFTCAPRGSASPTWSASSFVHARSSPAESGCWFSLR